MKHLIIICNLESLRYEQLKTSSSRYELSLALDLSKKIERVSIVSPKAECESDFDNIALYRCKNSDLQYRITNIKKHVKKLIKSEDKTVILFWGYNPLLIGALSCLKNENVRITSMVYDTHLAELSSKTQFSKFKIKMFYGIGMRMASCLDGLLLFKRNAERYFNPKLRKCFILPTVDTLHNGVAPSSCSDRITFLYAGTLCDYNGIRQLLSAFSKTTRIDMRLRIFGDGPLTCEVLEASQKDGRIYYGGRVFNAALKEEIARADYLLNLRDLSSVANDFGFPSKILEYFEAKKPVISTMVSDEADFEKAVFLVESVNETDVFKMLMHVAENREEAIEKVNNAIQYANTHHNKGVISAKIIDFFFNQLF